MRATVILCDLDDPQDPRSDLERDGGRPQVHRIGGRQWKTLRRKTEAAI